MMKINERNIFYIDGAGAILSIFILGLVLPTFQHWHGMPRHILYGLCIWAVGCFLYNVCCIYFGDRGNAKWLAGIMVLNSLYCIITMVLLVIHFSVLTRIGVVYFISEIPVLVGLVLFEKGIYQKAF